MNTLHIQHLSKHFEQTIALNDITLQVAGGEFIALLGPSGCGKTTLLRLIAGFDTPSKGKISVDHLVYNDTGIHLPPEKRGIGMVFQSYALWPHMTVRENICYPLKLKGIQPIEQRLILDKILEQTALAPYADRYPKGLSGGQQQRVALARCLVTQPKLILLDEPLANLDRHLRANMEATFREFNRNSGTTFIYVTHDQQEAMALADRIAVLENGNLRQYATPEVLYHTPINQWVATFIGEGSTITIHADCHSTHLHGDTATTAVQHPEHNQQALIHPQHIHIHPQGKLTATVTSSIYRGERHQLYLQRPDAQRLIAYAERSYPIGEAISFDIEKLWILPQH